jgi:uncharacterized membrane protein YqaE (UPF0057 family)
MKRIGFLSTLMIGFLLSSCGIMKNNDFSARKYTHFRKGEAVAATKDNSVKVVEENISVIPAKLEVLPADDKRSTIVTENSIALAQTNSKTENTAVTGQNNTLTASITKKERVQRIMNFIKDRIVNKGSTASVGQYSMLLLVVLAILIPPLAVFLARGAHTDFWIDLILALFGLGFFANILFGIAYLIAIIYALVIVLK